MSKILSKDIIEDFRKRNNPSEVLVHAHFEDTIESHEALREQFVLAVEALKDIREYADHSAGMLIFINETLKKLGME